MNLRVPTPFAFTNHLAAIDDQSDSGVGKLLDWPGATTVARRNEGAAGITFGHFYP